MLRQPRDKVTLRQDRLPALPLLRHRLFAQLLREFILDAALRWLLGQALRSQRKGPAKVDTLRVIVAAQKPG